MDVKGKCESKLQTIGLSCDAFTTGYLVMCLLFFAPYAVLNGGTVVMWLMPLACLLPFALMPLFYWIIHRYDSLLFGRYHLAMPLSAVIAALFFVIAWSADGIGAAQSCLMFFGAAVFAASIMIYRYCAFSVRVRLNGVGVVGKSPCYYAFCAAGAVASVATLAGFWYYEPATAFLNTAYIMGAACLVLALLQYFTSYYGIPQLGGKRVQTLKSAYRSFYGGLDKKMYFSALLFEAAFAVSAVVLVYFCTALGVDMYRTLAVAAVMTAAYGISAFFCTRRIKRRTIVLSAVDFACVVLPCALLTVLAALSPTKASPLPYLFVAAAFLGAGGAVVVRQTKLRFLTVKPRITGGIVFILLELTMFAAAAFGMTVVALVHTVGQYVFLPTAFIYGFAAAAASASAAFALAGKRRGGERKQNAEAVAAVTVEPVTATELSATDGIDATADGATGGDGE